MAAILRSGGSSPSSWTQSGSLLRSATVIGTESARTPRAGVAASLTVFMSLAAVVCGITLLFLAMRSIMEIGGSCGSDGVHIPVRPCPEGVPLAAMGGIFGGVIALFVYIWATAKYGVPAWAWLGWPALFLSLGWNFLEFGIDPPGTGELAWGWLVCGVVFVAMGGVPLVAFAKPLARAILPLPARPEYPYPGYQRPRKEPVVLVEPTYDPGPPGDRMGSSGEASVVAALERLSELHRSGALTDEEFSAAKERVLEEGA
ncbi:MAG: SHOCT domain-containing protein [Dehalococcoidia bacterium]|nr:SHOCT domain-containing protein [Chloroflexi bacterium CFX7]NUQ54429.1 SHOCT domain-containing protein [Dehalococcoidia bacterium]RIL02259.1 MAG: hypothetical protein DCC78_07885 [bacterium]